MKQVHELHAEICKTLANPKRIEVIDILRNKEMSAGELLSKLMIKKANLSQHLAVMRSKGIVKTRRKGVKIYYRLANPKIIKACDMMKEVLLEHLAESGELIKKMR